MVGFAGISRLISRRSDRAGVQEIAIPSPTVTPPQTGAAPAERRGALWKTALVTAQLGLLLLAINRFLIESAAFRQIAAISVGGFVVHAALPVRYRLPFFLVLSLGGIGTVFGLENGAWLVALGLLLIALCHLPGPGKVRVGALLLVGALLAFLRTGRLSAPWSPAIWPILGSMFMFRTLVYLYDLAHEKEKPTFARSLSYFFLLPNVCFPLFPVVDFKTFRRTHYDDDSSRIYQVGVHWMIRGVVHLLLYRLVYTHYTPDPSKVQGGFDLARFLVTNFLLYFRVSGQFHLVIGMLHLFGFNLPETNHRYGLSSSFTDFWRRINIYWKDFMMKIFYYPLYFWLRRWGGTFALVAATAAVFVVTWLLHSYQWFWIRGAFPITSQDLLFWGVLCALVIANSLYEARYGRKRSLGKARWSLRSAAPAALRTAATFAAICALWSLWTCDSLAQWGSLWRGALAGLAVPAGLVVVGLAAAGGGTGRLAAANAARAAAAARPYSFARHAAATAAAILVVLSLSSRRVQTALGPAVADLMESIRAPRLSQRDEAAMERGYYENLMDVNRMNSQLWEVFVKRPEWPYLYETPAGRKTNDYLGSVIVPSTSIVYHGAPFQTNRWGMRDREYEDAKPSGTYRVALLGSSHVMGSGVADGETFENLCEDELTRAGAPTGGARCEWLDFAVAGYSPLEQAAVIDDAVWRFAPDAVFYVAHSHDREEVIRRLVELLREGIDPRYPELREIVRRSGIEPAMLELPAQRQLDPYGKEMIAWLYGHLAAACRERGVLPVWIFLPRVTADPEAGIVTLQPIAESAGFVTLDLSDTYANRDVAALHVAEWDHHPNAEGHRLIAARLLRALTEKGDAIPPALRGAAAAPDPAPNAPPSSQPQTNPM